MARPRKTEISWHKQYVGIRHEAAFKKIRAMYPEAYSIYRELGDILAEQPEQSLPFDEATLNWLAKETGAKLCKFKEVLNLLIGSGYVTSDNELLSIDSVSESAEIINAEKARQRKKNNGKNTDNGYTPGNTEDNTNGFTDSRVDKSRIDKNSSSTDLINLLIKEGYDKGKAESYVLKAYGYKDCVNKEAYVRKWLAEDGIKPVIDPHAFRQTTRLEAIKAANKGA